MTFARRPGPLGRFNRRGLGSGGGWSPAQLSGLVYDMNPLAAYVTESAGRVSAIADASGTGDANKNLAQSTAGKQPLWTAADSDFRNRPSLTFDKTRADYMNTGTWGTAMPTASTWLLVGRVTAYDSSGFTVLMDSRAAGARQALYYTTADNKLNWFAGSAVAGAAITLPKTFITLARFGASGNLHQEALTPTAGNVGTQVLAALALGGNYNDSGGQNFTGKLARVIGWNRDLTTAEIATLLPWVAATYGGTIGA